MQIVHKLCNCVTILKLTRMDIVAGIYTITCNKKVNRFKKNAACMRDQAAFFNNDSYRTNIRTNLIYSVLHVSLSV